VTFATVAVAKLHRISKWHSLVLAFTCCTLLLFNLAPHDDFAFPGWTSNKSSNEDAVDRTLQEAADTAMGQHEGAIVVMDPRTGRVRAVVNSDLAFSETLMPGSTIKPFTALAALRSGLINPESRTVCPGRFTGRSFSLPCVHADHLPPFTPTQALAYSCNYYFATLGERLGRDKLIETLREFGFGQASGISAESEPRGSLSPCDSGIDSRIRARDDSQTDCAAREAIGESDRIQVTPIQLLTAYSALVNGGHLYQPRLTSASAFQLAERNRIEIAPAHRDMIIDGLRGVTRYGTAKSAHLDSLPLNVIGKTGTSVPPKGFRPNGWFVGFAAEDNYNNAASQVRLAVLVLIKNSHGAQAAALSRSIFEAYANINEGGPDPAISEKSTSSDPPKPQLRDATSAVKVHLVHDNVTETLSLEDYVLGVMRAEGTTETEPEALKALAIAIRTYALKNIGRHAKDGYDFCSTTHCQRFVASVRSPTVSEGLIGNGALVDAQASETIIQAVRSTEGQVLLDNRGQLVDSYFGASCGGETANIGTLWGGTPPTYLRGVRDEYCVIGAHAIWTDVITRPDLLRALQSDARTNVGSRLDAVIVNKRDETGRAEFITLEGEHRKVVRGWDFKIVVGRVLGWNVLKSSRFEISRSGSNFIFHGSGFGHGLGLCQEGAHVMAARGANYQKILEKYLPGTNIKKEAETRRRGDPGKTNASGWKADAMPPAISFDRGRYVIKTQPRSGDIFMEPIDQTENQLRRSDISSNDRQLHSASTELQSISSLLSYEHFVPTRLNTPTRFLTISSEHFRVTYPTSVDRRDADQVLNTLESARGDFLRRASSASIFADIATLEIRLNESTGDFTARTGQPWWAAAATKGNRIELQPVGILKKRGVLATTLRHELAHAVIDAISHNRAPRWLEEGFALYLAGEGQTISRYAAKTQLTADELERKLERPSSQQEMRALYALAYQKVSELIHGSGEAAVWKQIAQS
jgi:SpoIID/LytB domain protein